MGRASREKRERRQQKNPPWTPFARFGGENPEIAGEILEIYKNSRYTVIVRRDINLPNWPNLIHLSIRRNDRGVIHDWRDMQRIKNELVGKECEGLQLFPQESRLVDTSNHFHMYVTAEPYRFPFGYQERLVADTAGTFEGGLGTVQRPFEEGTLPPDAVSHEEMTEMTKEYVRRKS